MSGTIGIIADSAARYTAFTQSLAGMLARMPINTQVRFKIGSDKGASRNWLVQDSLDSGSEWLFFIDDDHTFASTVLLQLLLHEQPIVASLCLQRENPFWPTCYESRDDNGMFTPLDLTGKTGLVPIVAAGTAGMLIRSEVFHEIGSPWFLHTDECSEDLYFCTKAAAAGFQLFVDLDSTLGHINPMTVVPHLYEGRWVASLVVSATMMVSLEIGDE
jgi:hypothetical protein